jgi:ParB family chromosome partitioning protein
MAQSVRLIEPHKLQRNKDNPRLIFRQEELEALQDSIATQGILVPLTIYQDGSAFHLLDGERRWTCALKLGLSKVPVIIQPKPDRMQNIMLMFATHKARKDWDPLPTALKLEDLESEFEKRYGKKPTEKELAGVASLRVGEVRRLRKLLGLPREYRNELIKELEKPKSKQDISVDHVIEATRAAESLRKKLVITEDKEDSLRRAIINKFRSKVITNTVSPRKLVKLGQAVARMEVPKKTAGRVIDRLINDPSYSIDAAYIETVEKADFEHTIEQLAERLIKQLNEHEQRGYDISDRLLTALKELTERIKSLTG